MMMNGMSWAALLQQRERGRGAEIRQAVIGQHDVPRRALHGPLHRFGRLHAFVKDRVARALKLAHGQLGIVRRVLNDQHTQSAAPLSGQRTRARGKGSRRRHAGTDSEGRRSALAVVWGYTYGHFGATILKSLRKILGGSDVEALTIVPDSCTL